MNKTPLVELRNIRLNYGEYKVLNNFNFQFLEKNKYQILGENGAGKTSLLNLVAEMKSPTDGKVVWNRDETIEVTRVNFVSAASVGFFNHLTGEENLKLLFHLRKVPLTEWNKRLDPFYLFHNFAKCLETSFSEASMGMRKVLLLSSAFLFDTHLIILDEPFLHLDEKNKQNFINYLTQWRESAILIATPEGEHLSGFERICLT